MLPRTIGFTGLDFKAKVLIPSQSGFSQASSFLPIASSHSPRLPFRKSQQTVQHLQTCPFPAWLE